MNLKCQGALKNEIFLEGEVILSAWGCRGKERYNPFHVPLSSKVYSSIPSNPLKARAGPEFVKLSWNRASRALKVKSKNFKLNLLLPGISIQGGAPRGRMCPLCPSQEMELELSLPRFFSNNGDKPSSNS